MKNKYAVLVTEFIAHYEEEARIGWDQTSKKLHLFDDSQQAEEALISLYEKYLSMQRYTL